MKVWIVCVLLCAAFTFKTTAAAAIETEPEQDQKLPVPHEETTELVVEELIDEGQHIAEDKEEPLKAVGAAKAFCPSGWLKYGSRCFRLMRSSLSWLNAEAQCVAERARLVSIHSHEEYKFLQSLLDIAGLSQAWIGAYYFQGAWLWADTTRFYYNNWNSLNSASSYPCAFMRNNVGWSNTNCASGCAYFCAIDLNAC